uniref:Uncharacterized protein n=1 Tax=Anguilla anguilla TaxID=7936 RepID=A0A0E9PSH9_ANGAN
MLCLVCLSGILLGTQNLLSIK